VVSARHVLALLPALGGGCVLLVEGAPDGASTLCRFESDDTACGQCIANACRRELGACCANDDGSCGKALAKLDECARGPGPKVCALAKSIASHGAPEPLAECIERSCVAACFATGAGGAGRGGAAGRVWPSPALGENTLLPCSGDDSECPPDARAVRGAAAARTRGATSRTAASVQE
jgi:hypothetical protein